MKHLGVSSPGLLAAWLGADRAETSRLTEWRTRGMSALERSRLHAAEIRCMAGIALTGEFVHRPSRMLTREWREEIAAAWGVEVEAVEVKR